MCSDDLMETCKKEHDSDVNKKYCLYPYELKKRKHKSKNLVITAEMWKIDDPLKLSVNIIKYVSV